MGNKHQLFDVADSQQGFFTAKQAVECGYSRSNFHIRLTSGEWIQEGRGLYRLGRYPVTDRPELVLWSLWSRNNQDLLQGIWSHETALDVHELSDVMPSKMHMTVPPIFRRRSEIPKVICLYYCDLPKTDVEERQGYKVTTPLRTIMDCTAVETIADNLLIQALKQALERGIILQNELIAMESTHQNIYKKIMSLLNDANI